MLVGAVLAACTSDPAPPPPPPPVATSPAPIEPAPTSLAATTSTTLGFEVPATIDVPYVQRVLDENYRLDGEAARYLYAKRLPDPEFNERLEAIFGEPELEAAKSAFGREAAQGLTNLADPPGDPVVNVVAIVDSGPGCVVVRGGLSFKAMYKEIAPPSPEVLIQLLSGNVERFNPTPWGVVAAGPATSTTNTDVC